MTFSNNVPIKVNLRGLFLGLQKQMITCLSTSRESIPHPGTKGDATEIHWLNMFNQYLPERYRADKAFVIDSEGHLSEQSDVVIYDRQYSPFLFNQDNAKYVPAESVYATLEVKQEISAQAVEYAGRKIASVRRLHRLSVPIPHAGGVYTPKKLTPILGGFLALDSESANPFGESFRTAARKLRPLERLDLGCVLKCGAFEFHHGKKPRVEISAAESALIFFFLRMLSILQKRGTVAALDFEAYGRAV